MLVKCIRGLIRVGLNSGLNSFHLASFKQSSQIARPDPMYTSSILLQPAIVILIRDYKGSNEQKVSIRLG